MKYFILIILFSLTLCFSKSELDVFEKITNKKFITIAKELSQTKKVSLYKYKNIRFAYFKNKKNAGFIVITGEFAAIGGFEGPSSVAILIDKDVNKITNSKLVESLDTPDYVDYFVKKGFFKQFKNKGIRSITKKNKNNFIDVDAVSGATFTSNSIKDALNITLKKFIPIMKTLHYDIRKKQLISKEYKIKLLKK